MFKTSTTMIAMSLALGAATLFAGIPVECYEGLVPHQDQEKLAFTGSAPNMPIRLPLVETRLQGKITLPEEEDKVKLNRLFELDAQYEQQANYKEEEKVIFDAIALVQKSKVLPQSLLGSAYLKLSSLYSNADRLNEAEAAGKMAIVILKGTCPPVSPDLALALNNLGCIEYQLEKPREAILCIRQALYIVEKIYGRNSIRYAWMANNLGEAFEAKQDERNAAFWYMRCNDALIKSFPDDNELARSLKHRSQALQSAQPHRHEPTASKKTHKH